MRFMSSLDPKDRSLLLWSLSIAIGLALIIGFVFPNENNGDNPMPSTYLSGRHGARAAYESLLRSGYSIERWERPLGELAATAGPNTVVIFAQPFTREAQDFKAVEQIVARGGRVLATGFWGGYLVPDGDAGTPKEFAFSACRLEPEGRQGPGQRSARLDQAAGHPLGPGWRHQTLQAGSGGRAGQLDRLAHPFR